MAYTLQVNLLDHRAKKCSQSPCTNYKQQPHNNNLTTTTPQRTSIITCRSLEGKNVYMVAATLRPETMYGQTNCWIHPTIKYVACLQTSGEVFISTRRSALNMAYQGFSKEDGKVDVLVELVGQVRNIGLYSISCPNTCKTQIYSII